MNNILSQEQETFISKISMFSEQEVKTRSKDMDEQGYFDENLIRRLSEIGLLGATFPKEYGGLELDPLTYGYCTEEIGKSCSNTRTLMTVHVSLVGETVLRWGSQEQKNEWIPQMARGDKIGAFALSEENTGSNAKGIATTYIEKHNKFIINGEKKFISFGDIADFLIVIARNNQEITAFIIERDLEGISTEPIKGLLGSRGSHVSKIYFNNVVVPADRVLGLRGSGFTYIVNTALDHGRYSIAWGSLGIAQASLEEMIKYASKREQFGKRIVENQLIQGMIGDAMTHIHAARALCIEAGLKRRNQDTDSIIHTSMAKYYSSKIAMEIATDAVQVHGGNGCYNTFPVERFFREAKILEIIEGTSQIQQQLIAQYGLKKYSPRKTLI